MISFDFMAVLAEWPLLLKGLAWTLGLTLIATPLGLIIATLGAWSRASGPVWLRRVLGAYVELLRNTPFIVQLFFIFFGLPAAGVKLSPEAASLIAMTLNLGAYGTEILRSGIQATPRGQWEAAQSLALSFGEQLRHVVLPQALRIGVPPTVGFLVQVIKGTALASVIGFVELTKAGSMISNATYQPFLVYACVALLYFVLCFPVSLVAQSLERKLHGNRH